MSVSELCGAWVMHWFPGVTPSVFDREISIRRYVDMCDFARPTPTET